MFALVAYRLDPASVVKFLAKIYSRSYLESTIEVEQVVDRRVSSSGERISYRRFRWFATCILRVDARFRSGEVDTLEGNYRTIQFRYFPRFSSTLSFRPRSNSPSSAGHYHLFPASLFLNLYIYSCAYICEIH